MLIPASGPALGGPIPKQVIFSPENNRLLQESHMVRVYHTHHVLSVTLLKKQDDTYEAGVIKTFKACYVCFRHCGVHVAFSIGCCLRRQAEGRTGFSVRIGSLELASLGWDNRCSVLQGMRRVASIIDGIDIPRR